MATLEAARQAIRKRKAAGLSDGVTVHLRGGLYALPQTFKLGAQDSGTAAAPVQYRAYREEKPVLIGGRPITRFVPHQGSILKADVAAWGLAGIYFRQLVFDGRRQHLARWPNYDPQNPYGGGWAYVDGKLVPMYADIPGENRHTLIYKPQDARRWSRPTEGEVFIFPRYNWWNNIFVESRLQQIEYNGWTREHPYWKEHLKTMIEGYEMVALQPAWQKMRNMHIHPRDAVLPDGKIMSGNEFHRNIIYYKDPRAKLFSFSNVPWDHYQSDYNLVWHFGQPLLTGQTRAGKPISEKMMDPWAAWQAMGFDRNSLVADPQFVDPDHDDYRLKPESPALKLGFHPIPVERIGPYRDEFRASWPIVEAPGAREKPLTAQEATSDYCPRGGTFGFIRSGSAESSN